MTKCHRISFELISSSKIRKEEYETCTRWIDYIQVSFGFLTWTYEYAFSFLSESSWLPLEALPRWLGRAYTALRSLDDGVPTLSFSFLEFISPFLRRNYTGCLLVIVQCGQCFQICKLNILRHHLSGMIDTKNYLEVVVVHLSQRFLDAQYHWLRFQRF